MVKRTREKGHSKDDWEYCPICGASVKSENLPGHLKNVHKRGKESREIKRQESKVRNRQIVTQPRMSKKVLGAVVASVVILLVVSAIGYPLFLSSQNNGNASLQTQPNIQSNTNSNGETNWLDNYTPRYHVGSESDDWWIYYPSQHPNTGYNVSHLQWILDSLANKPVVILDHSEGCAPCIAQQKDMNKVLETYGDDVVYYDLLADGSDQRAYDVLNVYDPNDEQSYIPLTVIVTIIKDNNGNAKIAWHSIEGATGEDWIKNYMKDAICYYHQNSDEWRGG